MLIDRLTLAAVIVAAGLFGPPLAKSGTAQAASPAPHRAVYSMVMEQNRSGSDLSDIRGTMAMEWADTCDGWALNQKMLLAVIPAEGARFDRAYSFTSYESKDGLLFRFNMRITTNGTVTEDIAGRATLTAPGGPGEVVFTEPEGERVALPAGTVFPTEHLLLAIDGAMADQRGLERDVFIGTDIESLYRVSGFLGREVQPGTRPVIESPGRDDRAGLIAALADLRSYIVSFGYYPSDADDEAPEFEVTYRLMENAVAPYLDLDYGDYVIRGLLDYLEYLPDPGC